MKKYISRSRREYEAVYSDIRRYGGMPYEEMPFGKQDEIADCALLSFDNRDNYLLGWANVQRWRIWKSKIYNRWDETELPF